MAVSYGPSAELTDRSPASRMPEPPREDGQHDREVVAAITTGDPAGIALAYDRYATALYDYSYWILQDSAAAAGALKDTFIIAAATLSNLSEPSKLRPWLFALARNECRRRIRPASAVRDREADAAASRPMRPMSWPMRVMICRMRRCSSGRAAAASCG